MPNPPESSDNALVSEPATPAAADGNLDATSETPQPARYGANIRLINARRADEQRTNRIRRWWQPKA